MLHETFNWKSLSIIGGLTWYEGTRASRPEEMDEDMAWPAEGGVLFKGSKGKMLCDHVGMNPKLLPLSRHLEYKRPPRTLPRVPGNRHEMEWVNAIKNNTKCGTDFEYAGPLTEICLLGNVATRSDGWIEWDAANMRVKNNDQACQLIRTPYRSGWSL